MAVNERIFDDIPHKKIQGTAERAFICPLCLKQDGKYKLYFNLERATGKCHRCGRTFSLVKLLTAFGKTSNSKTPLGEYRTAFKKPSKSAKNGKDEVEIEAIEVEDIFKYPKAVKYLKDRNLSKKDIMDYGIGYCKEGRLHDRVIFPIFFEGEYVGSSGRTIIREEPKYLFTKGFKYSRIVWPTIHIRSTTVLVEGILDAIRVEGVCTFTSHLNKNQASVLSEYGAGKIMLAWDIDCWELQENERQTKVEKAVASLKEYFPLSAIRPIPLPKGKDPADLGKKRLEKIMRKYDNLLGRNVNELFKRM